MIILITLCQPARKSLFPTNQSIGVAFLKNTLFDHFQRFFSFINAKGYPISWGNFTRAGCLSSSALAT